MQLYKKIVECNGLIISEYPINFLGTFYTFPERNRIIAGLSSLLVVIQAGISSGSLITANFAIDQGKDVFVVPRVKIGKGAVVGARSSVFKDLEGGYVYAGSPVKMIKNRNIKNYWLKENE